MVSRISSQAAFRSTIKAIQPTTDGTYTAWTPSSGTTQATLLTETPIVDSTSISTTATNNRSSFNVPAIPTGTNNINGPIHGIQTTVRARKLQAAASAFRIFTRQGTTDTESGDRSLNDNFSPHFLTLDTSPATGTSWTASEFNSNALQVGVKSQS